MKIGFAKIGHFYPCVNRAIFVFEGMGYVVKYIIECVRLDENRLIDTPN